MSAGNARTLKAAGRLTAVAPRGDSRKVTGVMEVEWIDDRSVRMFESHDSSAGANDDGPFPYTIVLVPFPRGSTVARGAAINADQATVAFHTELQQLRRERRQGELMIVKHNDNERPILREALRSSEVV